MSRRDELVAIIPEESLELVSNIIDDVVFLERRLEELRKLPFIQTHPNKPELQRSTPASKQYKEFLQQYINCIKMIEYVIYKDKRLNDDEAEESPLRKWFRENVNTRKENLDA